MPVFSEFTFKSATAVNDIFVRKCVPDGDVRGVVQIAHGIAEHSGRYTEFMRILAENGFVVAANDHLGHGQSAKSEDEKGFFAASDGWSYVVWDMVKLHDIMAAEYPGLPYIMFGHSMGSFLTRNYLIDYPDKYDFAIISGTGHQSPLLVNAGLLMGNALVKANGAKGDGQKLNDIAFGSYLARIPDAKTPFDWLSRDSAKVAEYIADPMCGFVCRISLYRDMMQGIRYITNRANIAKMDKDKPVYFMSGDADPVGDYGVGVDRAYKAFCRAGLKDVFMRLYPDGRHEMLNELNREFVYIDILEWLNGKLAK